MRRWGFQKGLRTSSTLPKITSMCQVKCPQELYQVKHTLTYIHTVHCYGKCLADKGRNVTVSHL